LLYAVVKDHNGPSIILSQNISLRRKVGCIVWWGLEMHMAEAETAPCTKMGVSDSHADEFRPDCMWYRAVFAFREYSR
jgi:hypothetical protein